MNKLVLKSPAKLNLYLNVLRKRPDGYHDIETLFEKIALFDIITIRANKKGIRVTTNNPGLPTDRRNLVYRAIELLFKRANFKDGVWVDIRKNIPISAGLGGGSSNAAITLLGANRFFKLGLKRKELINLGKKLGADVPFFLYDCSFAIGRGRGEEIFPLYNNINPAPPAYSITLHRRGWVNIWHIIIFFNFGISTPGVYKWFNLRLTPAVDDVKIPARLSSDRWGGGALPFLVKNDIENLATSLYNRLEEVVLDRFDIIRTTKRLLLKEGAYGAVLSGSGPTVFGVAKTREEAIAVGRRVEKKLGKKAKIFVVSTFLHR